MPDQPGNICGRGRSMLRFADALLRIQGATQVTLRLADPATGDTGSQLGLEAPASEDLPISPAVVKPLTPMADGRRRFEVVVGASSLRPIAKLYGVEDLSAWLIAMTGMLMHGALLRIDTVSIDQFAGTDCLFHLTATE